MTSTRELLFLRTATAGPTGGECSPRTGAEKTKRNAAALQADSLCGRAVAAPRTPFPGVSIRGDSSHSGTLAPAECHLPTTNCRRGDSRLPEGRGSGSSCRNDRVTRRLSRSPGGGTSGPRRKRRSDGEFSGKGRKMPRNHVWGKWRDRRKGARLGVRRLMVCRVLYSPPIGPGDVPPGPRPRGFFFGSVPRAQSAVGVV